MNQNNNNNKKILTKFNYVCFGFGILSRNLVRNTFWHHHGVKGQGNSLVYMCSGTNKPPLLCLRQFPSPCEVRHTDWLTSSRSCFHHIKISEICEQQTLRLSLNLMDILCLLEDFCCQYKNIWIVWTLFQFWLLTCKRLISTESVFRNTICLILCNCLQLIKH